MSPGWHARALYGHGQHDSPSAPELTGNTFTITGAVIGGVGTAAVLLGLGAFFTAQEERKRKAGAPALTPEIRGVFDRMLAGSARQARPGNPAPKAESKEGVFIKTVSGLLSPLLSQGRENPKKAFGAVMTNKRAMGYVFGIHDAMLQALGLRGNRDAAKDLMESSYKGMFGESAGFALLSMSLSSQDDPAFHKGRMEGGGELDSFLSGGTPPAGLAALLSGEDPPKDARAAEGAGAAGIPSHNEFGNLMFEMQRVFRNAVRVPQPKDTAERVLQNSSIYGAISPLAYGLVVLRLAETSPGFIGSQGHEGLRRMVEDRMVKNRMEVAAGMAAGMPKLPGGMSFQPDAAAIRKKVGEELQTCLDAVADGGSLRPRMVAQANLMQAYVGSAPFINDPSVGEVLLSEMSGFADSFLRNGGRASGDTKGG